MHILILHNAKIPALKYGGIERVIWYLGKELVQMGHRVSYLVEKDSVCDFADVYFINHSKPIAQQIPKGIDVVHFNFDPRQRIEIPYIVTMHGNGNNDELLDINTVFISHNHANRFGSECFVYNGMDWNDYGKPDFNVSRNYFHFLGDAAWRVKNVKGAIDCILNTRNEQLNVLGGFRLNFRMGFRFTLSPRIKFYGWVGGEEKNNLLKLSKGLIFPVRWHEPFGLAITESLYFGCPVFGTPHGSLPEIVNSDVGFLSNNSKELTAAIENSNSFSKKHCHDYAVEYFNSKKMAEGYLKKYEIVLNGKALNEKPPQLQHIQTEKYLTWK